MTILPACALVAGLRTHHRRAHQATDVRPFLPHHPRQPEHLTHTLGEGAVRSQRRNTVRVLPRAFAVRIQWQTYESKVIPKAGRALIRFRVAEGKPFVE